MGEFVLKEITMTLDPASIQRAINAVNKLSRDLSKALAALRQALLESGVEIARMNLELYESVANADMRSGDLMTSIRVETKRGEKGKGYLVAGHSGDHGNDSPYSYAVYFEFGFGTSNNYYRNGQLIRTQNLLEDAYQKRQIEKSSGRLKDHPSGRDVYRQMEDFSIRTLADGTQFRGWVYKNAKTGEFYTVKGGQKPKPFMYKTLQSLEKKAATEGGRFIVEYIADRGGPTG